MSKDSEQQLIRQQNREERDRIIEQVRALLRLGMSGVDVRRAMLAAHSDRFTSTRSLDRYLTVARSRNRECLDLTEDDALADSISFWSHRLQQNERRRAGAEAEHRAGLNAINRADLLLDAAADAAAREVAADLKQLGIRQVESARKTLFTTEQFAMNYQDRIDRLRGNYAPTKLAQTDSKGKDVPRAPQRAPEPVDSTKVIKELAAKLLARGVGQPVLPTANPDGDSPSDDQSDNQQGNDNDTQ